MTQEHNPEQDRIQTRTGLLTNHRVITFAGRDAASFLQGYVTCDTGQLSDKAAGLGAFTNLKGRVVANGWIWGQPAEVSLLISADLATPLAEFLRPYLNFSRTKLIPAETAPVVQMDAVHDGAGAHATAPSAADAIALGNGRYLLAPAAAGDSAGQPDLSDAWLTSCIVRNEAVIGELTSSNYLPQMLGLTDLGAVSFEKGCYLGQEVVARAQHRGEVKRRLQKVEYTSSEALRAGDNLLDAADKRQAIVINATDRLALLVSAIDAAELAAGVSWHTQSSQVAIKGLA